MLLRMAFALKCAAGLLCVVAGLGANPRVVKSDVLVIGAGPGGLSAALEAGRRGVRVAVADMSSVFGGHAVISEGGLSFVDTPLQRSKGIKDTAELAIRDFLEWGSDADPVWVKTYIDRSRADVHDWLTAMGLQFTSLRFPPGNSVPRFHENAERGFGVVKLLYRECLRTGTITFEWNTQVTELRVNGKRVSGARAKRLRTGEEIEFRVKSVVIATGGFQNNSELIRRHWPAGKAPQKILLGSGANSKGSGLALATKAGAALAGMNRQWNYTWGFPDPRDGAGTRGIFLAVMAAIWVNQRGERFTDEVASPKFQMADISSQPDGQYWAIFDAEGKNSFVTSGTEWADRSLVERLIFGSPMVKSASSVGELARSIGIPEEKLSRTIQRYNEQVEAGKDADYKRFGFGRERMQMSFARAPKKIERAPLYAMPMFIVTRKSLGGIRVDEAGRALNAENQIVPGLYAVGEVTGFAGINGSAGLEGTFIAPSILQGRIAGQFIASGATGKLQQPANSRSEPNRSLPGSDSDNKACMSCHNLTSLIATSRSAYWHFEQVHRLVLDRSLSCAVCHGELAPFRKRDHKINPVAQISNCVLCHVSGSSRGVSPGRD